MRKTIGLSLAFLLLLQSIPNAAVLSEKPIDVNKECSFRFNQSICDSYYKWGTKKQAKWKVYDSAYWNPEGSAYWKYSASELYSRYEQVSKDIGYLWSINPEYKDMKLSNVIAKIIIAWDITVIALLAGSIIGPALTARGFTMAGRTASLLPTGSAQVAARVGIRQGLKNLIVRMQGGKFWADLGITFGLMVADGMFVEGAFYMFDKTSTELGLALQEKETLKLAVKSRNLLYEIMNPKLTKEQRAEFENNKKDIYNLKSDLKKTLKTALDKQGWKDSTDVGYLTHREAVVTLYALELIRAEMADMTDKLRYRKAAIDLAQVYLSEDLVNLPDRQELFKVVNTAYIKSEEATKVREEEIARKVNSGLPTDSKGTNYFRPGHHF